MNPRDPSAGVPVRIHGLLVGAVADTEGLAAFGDSKGAPLAPPGPTSLLLMAAPILRASSEPRAADADNVPATAEAGVLNNVTDVWASNPPGRNSIRGCPFRLGLDLHYISEPPIPC